MSKQSLLASVPGKGRRRQPLPPRQKIKLRSGFGWTVVALVWAGLVIDGCESWSTWQPPQPLVWGLRQNTRIREDFSGSVLQSITSDHLESTMETSTTTSQDATSIAIIDCSTLTLLEHINLNTPTQESVLEFYFTVLGCGMDPRKASNLLPSSKKKTIWANGGASQFHLPYGDTAQRIPGKIGLRYDSLAPLKQRVLAASDGCVKEWTEETDGTQITSLRLVDVHDNVFLCRLGGNPVSELSWKQPVIRNTPADCEKWGSDIINRFAIAEGAETDCRGMDFVEFYCPRGTAEKIALFYDSVLDATTCVLTDANDNDTKVTMIAIGNVKQSGQADQSILFRETDGPIPSYDGHHIALYVGQSAADFEQAFRNAQLAGIVWVNPRFDDQAMTLQGAKKWQQFRFKNIVDMETGKTIFELEHEMRSIEHEAWPGPRVMR